MSKNHQSPLFSNEGSKRSTYASPDASKLVPESREGRGLYENDNPDNIEVRTPETPVCLVNRAERIRFTSDMPEITCQVPDCTRSLSSKEGWLGGNCVRACYNPETK